METRKTPISLRREMAAIVYRHFPRLSWNPDDLSNTNLNPMPFRSRAGLSHLLSGAPIKLEVRSHAGGRGWSALFSRLGSPQWEDIDIEVFDPSYLAGAQRIGEDFEKATGKKAIVYTHY